MRGVDVMNEELFTVGGLDKYVPPDHPLRPVRDVFSNCHARMDTHFNELYSPLRRESRRESIPPEKLLRALMLLARFGTGVLPRADACRTAQWWKILIGAAVLLPFQRPWASHSISWHNSA
jgi:hypothetical protein